MKILGAKASAYYNIALGQLADFVLKRNPKAVPEIFRWFEPDDDVVLTFFSQTD